MVGGEDFWWRKISIKNSLGLNDPVYVQFQDL